ncbi:MAG TPA: leucyl aminopeptidase, partial [Pedococcus sp.]|nr:leucyl aminopeptidase [Pedococcus sp.]
MTTVNVTDRSAHDVKADVLVLGTIGQDGEAALAPGHGLPRGAASHLATQLSALHATGSADEVLTVAGVPGVAAPVVVLVGLGKAGATTTSFGHEVLRRAAGSALRSVKKSSKVAVALPATGVESVAAVAEGAALGAYRYAGVRGPAPKGKDAKASEPVAAITVVTPEGRTKAAKDAATRATVLADAKAYARDLVNTPPNKLFPQSFAESVKERAGATSAKVKVSVLDEKALVKGGFGGIVGVGQGSVNPPRIVTLTWNPPKARGSVALVGKGITFDSGGLCIKPANGMLTMKCDMAGAAAVAGAVLAIAELGLPIAVTGYLGLAENMPSASAQRPSDVVTMRGGKTVEVLNTDAEGRMVLGDCIALASESTPDAIVDIATLTGAQVIALADTAAVMGNDDTFRTRVLDAAQGVGEAMWPMPLP